MVLDWYTRNNGMLPFIDDIRIIFGKNTAELFVGKLPVRIIFLDAQNVHRVFPCRLKEEQSSLFRLGCELEIVYVHSSYTEVRVLDAKFLACTARTVQEETIIARRNQDYGG